MTTRSRARILDGVSAVDDDFIVTSPNMMTAVIEDTKIMDQILVNCSKLEKKKKTGQSEDDVNEDDLRSIIRGLLPVPINSDSQKQSLHRQQVQSFYCLAKTIINDKPMVNITNDRRFLVRTIIDAYPQKAFFQLLNRWARRKKNDYPKAALNTVLVLNSHFKNLSLVQFLTRCRTLQVSPPSKKRRNFHLSFTTIKNHAVQDIVSKVAVFLECTTSTYRKLEWRLSTTNTKSLSQPVEQTIQLNPPTTAIRKNQAH